MKKKSQDKQVNDKRKTFSDLKILIIHFRVGKLDGVSLEIDNWVKILKENGAEVKLCAGPVNIGADYTIPDLEQQLNIDIFKLDENSFGGHKDLKEGEFVNQFNIKRSLLEKEFKNAISDCNPDFIFVSNIFSVGENLPAACALLKVLDSQKIRTIAINHDFYWENKRYNNPSNIFVKNVVNECLVPIREYITHLCINNVAKRKLKERKGIDAGIIYDSIDFNQRKWKKMSPVQKYLFDTAGVLKDDVIILQATRIVRRKNIEIAIDFVKQLSEDISQNRGEKLYNGKKINDKTKVILLLAGYAEKRDQWYYNLLTEYAEKVGVSLVYIGDRVGSINAKAVGTVSFSLEDIYPYADMITYPSEYEGFGNQFLEAVFAQKPVAVFEYPVFKTDIKPKGFNYISFGDKKAHDRKTDLIKIPKATLNQVALQSFKLLTNSKNYHSFVNKNFNLGKKYFSFRNTFDTFRRLLLKNH
jgi:glycosyltransferase involved in cell wall biosynthesis